MLENRSFDHMLGKLFNPEFDNLSNPRDPANPIDIIKTNTNANYINDLIDPGHSIKDVNIQLFGKEFPGTGESPNNKGFVLSYSQQKDITYDTASNIMNCFDPVKLPVLTALAKEYAVCTSWYSSVPGPTWPNRFFVHCATSGGFTDNTFRNYPMIPIYKKLSDANISWNIYFHDFPQSLALDYLRGDLLREKYKLFSKFKLDAASGNLPSYSFIEPAYYTILTEKASDQHPPHDVKAGDDLIAHIYNSLLNSPKWNETLFIIIYDEHGGIFESKAPPSAINPDGKLFPGSNDSPPFNFDRLGLRVPAVIISPYINKSTIDTTEHYDHTSLLATVEKRFGLTPLTERDTNALTFDHLLSRDIPRNDCISLPEVNEPILKDIFSLVRSNLESLADFVKKEIEGASKAIPMQSQLDMLELAKNLNPDEPKILRFIESKLPVNTEHQVAMIILHAVKEFLNL